MIEVIYHTYHVSTQPCLSSNKGNKASPCLTFPSLCEINKSRALIYSTHLHVCADELKLFTVCKGTIFTKSLNPSYNLY